MAVALRVLPPLPAAAGSTVVYCRISAEDSDHGGVDRQRDDCLALAEQREWPVDAIRDVFVDDGFSASRRAKKRRPRWEAMLQRIAQGDVARVLVWNVDRLYRDPRDLLRLIDLTRRRVEVVTVIGGEMDLNSDDGVMRAGIMSFVAKREADMTSTRVKRKQDERRKLGQPHGGRTSFGWQDQVTPDPDEAALLRDAMAAVVRGATLYDLANRWTAAGVRRHGGPSRWSATDLRRCLASPRHAGLLVQGGEIAVDKDGQEIRAVWPAIVDRDLWDACRSILAGRATTTGTPRRRSWLTNVLSCGACGTRMTRSSSMGQPIWRCWTQRGGCGQVSIRAVPAEAVIEEGLFAYIDSDTLRSAIAARDDGRIVAIRAQLTDLDRQARDLVDAFVGGENARIFRAASDALDAKRRGLNTELGRASQRSPLEAYSDDDGVLRAAWPGMTTDQRRTVVLAAFGAVTIAPATRRGRVFDPSRVTFGAADRV